MLNGKFSGIALSDGFLALSMTIQRLLAWQLNDGLIALLLRGAA